MKSNAMQIAVASLLGASIAIVAMLYLNKDDLERIEAMEREVKEFRKETSDNFDTIRAEILCNRAKIDAVEANTDTLKAGQAVIYNAVMSFDKERPETGTPHEFIERVKVFFGF